MTFEKDADLLNRLTPDVNIAVTLYSSSRKGKKFPDRSGHDLLWGNFSCLKVADEVCKGVRIIDGEISAGAAIVEGLLNNHKAARWSSMLVDCPPENSFRLSRDFAALLLATDSGGLLADSIRTPFPGMLIVLDGIDITENGQSVDCVSIHVTDTKLMWSAWLGDSDSRRGFGFQGQADLTPGKTVQEVEDEAASSRVSILTLDETFLWDGDKVSQREASWRFTRLAINTLLYLSMDRPCIVNASNRKPVTKAQIVAAPTRTPVRLQTRTKLTELRARKYLLGLTETGNCLPKTSWKTMVRGHWKRQPFGKRRALRRIIWVKPYIRHALEEGNAALHDYVPGCSL